MLRRLWILLAQAVTVSVALVIVLRFFGIGIEPQTPEVVTFKDAATTPPPGATQALTMRTAAQKTTRSVVNIYTRSATRQGLGQDEVLRWRYFGEKPQPAVSLGSGVVVSADGHILTNNHVVEGAAEIAVVFATGEAAPARVIGTDPETDLAVLRVAATGTIPITFGDSNRLEVGDPVLAIGNPFGVGQTVTQGIVSATGRNRLGINTFENFIQTDAAINPGNSGGALVDISGALVGINTAIYSESGGSQGIGFAIPVSIARQVLEQIIKTGRVSRGWLGIEVSDVERASGGATGARVAGVLRGGPADAGGIKPGDIVLAIDGKPVADSVTLMPAIAAVAPGGTAEIRVRRAERELALSVQVGKRPPARRERAGR